MNYRRLPFLAIFALFSLFLSAVYAQTPSAADSHTHLTDTHSQTDKHKFSLLLGDELISAFSTRKVKELSDSQVFAEFDAWIKDYSNGNFDDKDKHQQLGEQLAVRRQEILKQLIGLDPQAALEKALSADAFKQLPSFIADRTEKVVSGNGDFLVYVLDEMNHSTGELTASRTERQVVIGGETYKAVVYGRREAMTTKLNIPLHGIVVGDTMIVDESPVQVIESAARPDADAAASEDGVTAQVGDKVIEFANKKQLNKFVDEQIKWESTIGPNRTGESSTTTKSVASSWTEGQKTVLVIRAVFSDSPSNYEPVTQSGAQVLMNNTVNQFFINNSYNKTSLLTTVTPVVVRLPNPQSYYISSYYSMIEDSRTAARAMGIEPNNYNLDVVFFPYTPSIPWAGLAGVGSKGNLINGAYVLPVVGHELGHNYGLVHANLWRTTDGTSIGSGSNIEYGDCYDLMGACGGIGMNSHFNARYKRILDWLTEANVQTVTSSGTYRISAQDTPTLSGIKTLKISKDSSRNYWVEFRQTLSGSSMNGALIRWDYSSQNFRETQLLDMTPSTNYQGGDETLQVGQSFYDSASQIRITVVGKGNTNPESLDIRVDFNGSNPTPTPVTGTPTPQNCSYSLSASAVNSLAVGGSAGVNVSTTNGCTWTANSNVGWVTVTSGNAGNGTGTVNFSVAANTTSGARNGTITIAGQLFNIQQAAPANYYTLTANPSVVTPGAPMTVSFTAPSGSSTVDWVGLYAVGTANTQYLSGGATNGQTSGTFNLNAPTQPGQYEFRYMLNNSFTSIVTSNVVTVQSTVPTPTPYVPTPTPYVPTPTPYVPTPTPYVPTPTPYVPTPTPYVPTPTPYVPTPTPTPTGSRTNVASASSGATATASSQLSGGEASRAIDGVRNWATTGTWKDSTADVFPDWLQVNFNGSKTINEVVLYSVKDDFGNSSDPTEFETFSGYGVTNFDVQYWNGYGWTTVQNGNVFN
ncbi:MAG TPA: BACON domain-containing carbohydrate-binding protein, partial [Pyrinomonadaceae bacterium]